MSDVQKKKFLPKLPKVSSLVVKIGTLVVVVLAVVAASYFFIQYRNTQKLLADPAAKGQKESEDLIEEVNKIYALPQGEPTIATVSDRDKLQNQQFFASAQNGDKVLIYTQAKKAILYRPSTRQVIEVGPITIQEDEKKASASAGTQSEKIVVAVYNGTTRTGLTKAASDKIAQVDNFATGERTNAAKTDYSSTIVVDISEKNKDAVEELAELLNATVGQLPTGEKSPSADILVILGADYQE